MTTIDKALKFNLIGTMARSHDSYHVENNIIHLVMSSTYCGPLPNLFEQDFLNLKFIHKALIIKIINSWDKDLYYGYEDINDKTVIFTCSVGYIISNLGKNNQLEILLEHLFGSRTLYRKIKLNKNHKDLNNKFSVYQGNVFFIFENLHWYNIKHIFNMMGISISGGSISKRHLLSVTQLNLIRFLSMLRFNIGDMFKTTTNISLKRNLYKAIQNREYNYGEDKNLIIYHLFFQILDELQGTITELLSIFYLIEHNLDIELKKLNSDVSSSSSGEQNLNSAASSEDVISEYKNMQSDIASVCDVCNKYRAYMLELWTKLNYLEYNYYFNENDLLISGITSNFEQSQESKDVSNLVPYLDLLIVLYSSMYKRRQNLILNSNYTKYINLLINQKLPYPKGGNFDISHKFNDENIDFIYKDRSNLTLNRTYKSKLKISFTNKEASNNRKYSTISFSGKLSNVTKIIPNSRKFSILKVNNDSIITKELMKLIYSPVSNSSDKEIIQTKIEKYLMEEQNNFLLKKISSQNNKIQFNILNPSLISLFLESKKDLEKLYYNYISLNLDNLKKSNKIEENETLNKVLPMVDFEYISNIIFGRLLQIISNNNRANKFNYFTEVSFDLGQDLINYYNYKQYNIYNKEKNFSFSLFKTNYSDKLVDSKNPTLSVILGSVLIGWLLELKLIENKVVFVDKKEKRNTIICGTKLVKILPKEKLNLPIANLPIKIPMIVPPKKYLLEDGKTQLGGYLLNDIFYTESLIIDNPVLVNKSSISDNNKIYKMIDNLNSVSFAINEDVLDFITLNYKKYNLIIDPDFKHPLEFKDNLTLQEKRDLESFLSKKDLEAEILKLAQIFRHCPKFYIPVRLDYRGRVYCNVEYLNYQGVELAKALLNFSKGEKVKLNDEFSINYLKIFGANCFGLSKKSFKERINWIDENIYNITNFNNGELISKAENKLLFISFCFEYQKYIEALNNNDSYFISHLPIQLDATCNGFQHLSLLLKDTTLAKQVNLSESNWDDTPDDFYSYLALKCKEQLTFELKSNFNLKEVERDSYKRLLGIDFKNHRNLVKKTIMTIPYNSTVYANINDMKGDFDLIKGKYVNKKDVEIVLESIDFKIICKTLYLCLYRDFPKLEALLNYFKGIAKIANKLAISIPWSVPSGLNVKQKFYGTKKIKIKPFIFTKDLLTLNVLDKNLFNDRKQTRALMPNLVHSLDAASLALLIENFFKEVTEANFYSVHDCFAVTCNNVNLIGELLKLSYYNIYINKEFLLKFDLEFKESIKNILGSDCFSKSKDETNLYINIITEEGNNIKLIYPNLTEVLNSGNLDFLKSSYILS